MKVRRIIGMMTLAAMAACGESPTTPSDQMVLEPDFQGGSADGWEVHFADLPTTELEIYELDHGVRSLPAPLDASRKALFVQGHNRSDDLFMFLTREVNGLVPGATYRVRFEIQIATSAGSGCVGIGGAPGESVYVKAGAIATRPGVVVKNDFQEVNFDKGQQKTSGPTIPTIGDVANGSSDCYGDAYRLKTLASDWDYGQGEERVPSNIVVKADAQGRLWLVVGTDSGFEGLTRLYYPSIRVTLTPVTI